MKTNKNLTNYIELIKDNQEDFNNSEVLTDFLNSYLYNEGDDIKKLEDYIIEYADGLVPVYYNDIVKEWQENADARGLAEEEGGIEDTKDPYKIMQADLCAYHYNLINQDYQKLVELIEMQD